MPSSQGFAGRLILQASRGSGPTGVAVRKDLPSREDKPMSDELDEEAIHVGSVFQGPQRLRVDTFPVSRFRTPLSSRLWWRGKSDMCQSFGLGLCPPSCC